MIPPLRVSVLGFSAFERSTFEAFFRLSTRRTPAYQLSPHLREADLVIADADSESMLAKVTAAGKLGQALLIGSRAAPGAARQLARPINLMNVVRVMDQMTAEATEPGAAVGPVISPAVYPNAGPSTSPTVLAAPVRPHAPDPAPASSSQVVLASLAQTRAQPQWAAKRDAIVAAQQPAPVASQPQPQLQLQSQTQSRPQSPALRAAPSRPIEPPVPEATRARLTLAPTPQAPATSAAAAEPAAERLPAMDDILVVDDSDIALRFMTGRLERFGFTVHLSRSGEDALLRTEKQHFKFVFMDVTMPGLDGFKTCKAIKRRPLAAGQVPPTVIMLTSRDTPVDKLRGTMAGCNGYLTKPLDETELLKIIGDRDITEHEFAETAQAYSAP